MHLADALAAACLVLHRVTKSLQETYNMHRDKKNLLAGGL